VAASSTDLATSEKGTKVEDEAMEQLQPAVTSLTRLVFVVKGFRTKGRSLVKRRNNADKQDNVRLLKCSHVE
jgi:hypothetical protein